MKHYITLFLLILSVAVKGQSPVNAGSDNQLLYQKGGFIPVRYFHPPMSYNPFPNYQKEGMMWYDSAANKHLYYRTNVSSFWFYNSHEVDSLFATSVGGVTQATLNDSCASLRSAISGGGVSQGTLDDTAAALRTAINLRELLSNKVASTGSPNNTTYFTTLGTLNLINTSIAAYVTKADSNTYTGYTTKAFYYANLPASTDTTGLSYRINQRVKYTDSGTVYYTVYDVDTAKTRLTAAIAAKSSIVSIVGGYGTTVTGTTTVTITADTATTFPKVLSTLGAGYGMLYNSSTRTYTNDTATIFPKVASTMAAGYAMNYNSSSRTYTPDTTLLIPFTDTSKLYGVMTYKKVLNLGYTSNTGTVTSVGLTAPSVFSVTATPITTSGTLGLVFAGGQSNNKVLGTGSSGVFSAVSLVAADLPATVAYTGNTLAQFTATTSAGFAGTISDETGTGVVVFSASPALTGSPTVPTAAALTSSTVAASTAYTDNAVTADRSATVTLTNHRITARVGSTTSSATPTINTDNVDVYKLTAQTVDITSMTTNLSGTPNDGDVLEIQITGTAARAITWGTSFVSSTITLPTTTVTTATLTVLLQYYTTSSYGNNKWVCAGTW